MTGVGWRVHDKQWTTRTVRRGAVVVGVVMLAACGSSPSADPAPSAAAAATTPSVSETSPTTPATEPAATDAPADSSTTTTRPPASTTTTTPTTTTVEVTTTVATLGPLEFVDGSFLGIAQGVPLQDVVETLGVAPVPLSTLDASSFPGMCTGGGDPSIIRAGGLTLAFEEVAADTIALTNWTYTGGPIAGYDELVAPNGIGVGDSRADLTAAYTDFQDFGTEIEMYEPFFLRFALDGDVIAWFGIIDCYMEGL